MTVLTVVRGGIVRPAPPKTSACDQHGDYTPGCPDCQARNRARRARQRKAAILGIHQPGVVPSIGAARRLQGMAVACYSATDLAPILRTHDRAIRRWRRADTPTISVRRHHDIRRLADALEGTTGPSRKARTDGYKSRWVPLAAWDDIDDPDEQPQVRSAAHERDGRVLIGRVLAGRAPIDLLTPSELTRLWRDWAAQRQAAMAPAGPRVFGRQFDISEHRARQIITAARASTDPSITNRKVA